MKKLDFFHFYKGDDGAIKKAENYFSFACQLFLLESIIKENQALFLKKGSANFLLTDAISEWKKLKRNK